jgi:hypothetical protein
VLVLTLNPLVLDFLVAARGYGLALALFLTALCDLLVCLSEGNGTATVPSRKVVLYRAGVGLALSAAANLTFLIPAIAVSRIKLRTVQDFVRPTVEGVAPTSLQLARLHPEGSLFLPPRV